MNKLPEPKTIDHPAIEFLKPDIDNKFEDFTGAQGAAALTGEKVDASYATALAETINMYAATPDQAGPNFFDFVTELPEPGKSEIGDAYTGYMILWHTRHGLYELVREEAVAKEMFRDEGENQDVDLGAAKEDDTPDSRRRDRDVSKSAESDQRASDDEISDIAFGGNARKTDDEVRQSSMAPESLRKAKLLLPEKTREILATNGGVPDPLIIREESFIRHDPTMCFMRSTRWLSQNIVQAAIGKDMHSVKGPAFPRIQPIIGLGVHERHIGSIINHIRKFTSILQPPKYEGGEGSH